MDDNTHDELSRMRLKKLQERSEKKLREEMAKMRDRAAEMPSRFLNAWVCGVKKLGADYFDLKCPLAEIDNKWQACPKTEFILKIAASKGHGQAALLGLMCSFYNSEDGQKILEKVNLPNFVDALAILDEESREIVNELWLNYQGW